MKREIGPGKIVALDELYEQYGEKHGLKEGKPFVEWLKQIKLRDGNVWQVVYNKDNTDKKTEKLEVVDDVNSELVVPDVKKEQSVDEIVNLSVREAREQLPKITDLKLLTYALQTTNQLANKDTLCRMIRKRVSELSLTKR